MSKNEALVLKIVQSVVPAPMKQSVTLASHLTDELSLDSIQFIRLVTLLEQEAGFDVTAGDIDVTSIRTVKDIVVLLP